MRGPKRREHLNCCPVDWRVCGVHNFAGLAACYTVLASHFGRLATVLLLLPDGEDGGVGPFPLARVPEARTARPSAVDSVSQTKTCPEKRRRAPTDLTRCSHCVLLLCFNSTHHQHLDHCHCHYYHHRAHRSASSLPIAGRVPHSIFFFSSSGTSRGMR